MFAAVRRVADVRCAPGIAVAFLGTVLVAIAWTSPRRAGRREAEARHVLERQEAASAAQPGPRLSGGVAELNFEWLSFPLEDDGRNTASGEPSFGKCVPARIRRYDGAAVRIKGFMLPIRNEGGRTREFVILANQMTCCYGVAPRFCEFITARMVGSPVATSVDEPVTFEGTLHVGDVYVDGSWSALYTMDCRKVTL